MTGHIGDTVESFSYAVFQSELGYYMVRLTYELPKGTGALDKSRKRSRAPEATVKSGVQQPLFGSISNSIKSSVV